MKAISFKTHILSIEQNKLIWTVLRKSYITVELRAYIVEDVE